jgi:hypothetical protein
MCTIIQSLTNIPPHKLLATVSRAARPHHHMNLFSDLTSASALIDPFQIRITTCKNIQPRVDHT